MFPIDSRVNLITGINRRGVYLRKVDLDLLLFLCEQKILSTEQLFRFHLLIQSIDRKRLSRKLTKFEKNGLVIKSEYILYKNAGVKMNVFRIGAAGLRLLKRFALVSERETPPQLYRNMDHLLGIKNVVLDAIEEEKVRSGFFLGSGGEHMFLLAEGLANRESSLFHTNLKVNLYENKTLEPKVKQSNLKAISDYKSKVKQKMNAFSKNDALISIFPSKLPFYQNEEGGFYLLPDWTFLMNNHIFHIEVDSGAERISKSNISGVTSIEGKFKRYINLAKRESQNIHNVIFVSLDDSSSLRKIYGNKEIRIRNLKREIARIEDVFQPNLNVYFLRLGRVKELWPSLLQKADKSFDHKTILTVILNSLHLNIEYFPYDVEYIESQKLNNFIRNPQSFNYPIQSLYSLKIRKDDNSLIDPLERILLPVIMLEGDLYCHELVTYYSERIEEGSLPPNTKVLAIYEKKSSMMEDVYRADTVFEHVLLVNIEEIQWFNTAPKFYSGKEKEELLFV